MKISNDYDMSFKNGYFVVHEKAVFSKESKNAGEQYIAKTITYPNLLCAWGALKERGVDGNQVLTVGEQLIIDEQKKAGREVLSARAKKILKDKEN